MVSVSEEPPPHLSLSLSWPHIHFSLCPSLCFIPPSSYLSKPLCGAIPSSPHHLSLSLSPPCPPPFAPPPCCFGAAACLLATTAHPLELSECFYKHTQEHTLIRARTHTCVQAQTHSHTHTLAGSSSSLRVAAGRPVSLQAFVAVR